MTTKANGGNGPNFEVSERAARRRFSAEYELGMFEEANRRALGERGDLLRREGWYSSHLLKAREQRSKGSLAALEQRVRLTRIAYGVPLGGDLEYADHVTVGICIENRRSIE